MDLENPENAVKLDRQIAKMAVLFRELSQQEALLAIAQQRLKNQESVVSQVRVAFLEARQEWEDLLGTDEE